MNAHISLLMLSFLTSLIIPAMEYTRQKQGRMGWAALAWLLFAGAGITIGFELVAFGPAFSIIAVYFVMVAGYWLRSLSITWLVTSRKLRKRLFSHM